MKTYIIKQGTHYAKGLIFGLFNFKLLFKKRLSGRLFINTSMWYKDIPGWNKIVGIRGFSIVKNPYYKDYIPKRLIYLVWRICGNKLVLGSYTRDYGLISYKEFTLNIEKCMYIDYDIQEFKDKYIISLDTGIENQTLIMNKTPYKYDCNIRLQTFPHFGGREVAPHDIIIRLQK